MIVHSRLREHLVSQRDFPYDLSVVCFHLSELTFSLVLVEMMPIYCFMQTVVWGVCYEL